MEKGKYQTSVVEQPAVPPIWAPQNRRQVARGLNFTTNNSTGLFYAKGSFTSGSLDGQWIQNIEISDLIKRTIDFDVGHFSETSLRTKSENSSIGVGNGTLHPLGMRESVFSNVVSSFCFPDRVGEILRSIHGCICKFTDEGNGQQWLTIIFSTPKGPIKELFCVMRISLSDFSTTCLVFDCEKQEDLEGNDGLPSFIRDAWRNYPAFRNPIGILSILAIHCGRMSEIKRGKGDDEVLNAEIRTRSTPWNDPNVTVVRSPSDYLKTVTFAHLCYNNLLFIENTVNFEIDLWEFINSLLQGEHSVVAKISDTNRRTLIEEIEYYKQWTKSRRSQVKCLQERNRVQINLITNLIAQEETSQSKIIGAVALLFAPASLVTSVFSAGLFVVDDKSWAAYLISTLVTTFLVLLLSWSYVQGYLQIIKGAVQKDTKKKPDVSVESNGNYDFV